MKKFFIIFNIIIFINNFSLVGNIIANILGFYYYKYIFNLYFFIKIYIRKIIKALPGNFSPIIFIINYFKFVIMKLLFYYSYILLLTIFLFFTILRF